ncbi:hypothetical protein [Staphylococcus carnosus]|uniref:Uncharacterized protein n=1 Tax=Staphylococcus carnosus TaxID=1281 RepID=A0AAJ0JPQ3_STACA|nr:hypothetical protein [Staphylococcus carnosus]ANZ32391.1 hypothetical protein BEK99_00300 [Staphylococcus carnosus]KKB25744.1 hypothetical protein VV61_03945 [Staphylococcus carnosus]KOR13162.1 hypothetical protein AMC75_07945 [Staphylococcus carnosus]POA02879.1 hypothetical protein CD153_05605 [Staphylococcus carnosus]QPT02850.1 hypothetical protein I6G40_06845 [Staphylococcus carnosus]
MKQQKMFTPIEWIMISLLVLLLMVNLLSIFDLIGINQGIQTLIWGVYFIIIGILLQRFNKKKIAVIVYIIGVVDMIVGVIHLLSS